jgi:hypothetical protein
MNPKENVLARFTEDSPGPPVFMPDLTLWYPWHKARGTLPEECRNQTMVQVAQALGAPAWTVERPWRIETVGLDIAIEEKENERIVRYEAPDGTLTERWALGPDGDWWQLEYPVKELGDLPAARAVIEARTYELDARGAAATASEIGDAGIPALEIPMTPYSDMLHTLLGWGEGLLLLSGEGRELLMQMLAVMEDKRQEVVSQVAALPGTIVLAPDNLDGRYLSPGDFRTHFSGSYRRTADVLHGNGKYLVVHAGGPFKHLLPMMADAGVDGIEGISGPPHGDATIKEAREAAGPELTLWGGIPQDFLVKTYSEEQFERAVREAARQATGDSRVILGIADRVPVDAEFVRIKAAARIIADAVQEK